MKSQYLRFCAAGIVLALPLTVLAQNIIRSAAPVMPSHTSNWKKADPSYSAWSNKGLPSNCSTWSPEPASVDIGKAFIQESTDCEQLQVRVMQEREYVENTQINSGGYRYYKGALVTSVYYQICRIPL